MSALTIKVKIQNKSFKSILKTFYTIFDSFHYYNNRLRLI